MDSFDKRFARTEKRIWIWMATCVVLSTATLVFLGWVVVKVMQHFGVV